MLLLLDNVAINGRTILSPAAISLRSCHEENVDLIDKLSTKEKEISKHVQNLALLQKSVLEKSELILRLETEKNTAQVMSTALQSEISVLYDENLVQQSKLKELQGLLEIEKMKSESLGTH